MKIIINGFSARLGGGRTYLSNLLSRLPPDADLDVIVYAPASLSLPQDARIRRGVARWPTENPLLRTVWEKFALPRVIEREKAHVLFCPGGVVATRVPTGCRTATMFRNMIPFDPVARARVRSPLQRLRNVLLHRVMLRSLANADLSIFISDHARNLIETMTPVRNPVTIVHGIGDAFRTRGMTIERPAALPSGEYLLYVSRFDVYKHHYELASAFADLPDALRRRYKLVLVGEDDSDLVRPVMALAAAHGLQDQIVVMGPVAHDKLPALYHHATVNLFASSCENCPNILLEALAAGRPVLSSDVMPMPEFGADAVSYFSPTDPASIRDALQRILESASERQRLGEAAALRSDDFDWARSASTTWKSILSLVGR